MTSDDLTHQVTRPGDAFKNHAKLGNRKLLWHGTNVAVRAKDGD